MFILALTLYGKYAHSRGPHKEDKKTKTALEEGVVLRTVIKKPKMSAHGTRTQ